MVEVKGIQKLSLVDYPGKLCATIFLGGCNFRCPYCYNKQLILEPEKIPTIPEEQVLNFLKERNGFLDGVCICGGEPTLHSDLSEFIRKIKKLGYSIKLDTNGSNPEMLKKLFEEELVDYVAMDIKAPLEKYEEVSGVKVDIEKLKESIELIRGNSIEFEFRITAVPGLVNERDLIRIGELLKGSKRFFIQQFRPKNTLVKRYENVKPYSQEELENFADKLKPYFEHCGVRN